MAGEKTEKATPKRRQDERKKGNVFQGRDIVIAFNLLVMFTSLKFLGGYIYKFLQQTMAFFVTGSGNVKHIGIHELTQLSMDVIGRVVVLVLPLMLISAVTSFILSGIQTKFIFSTKQIAFKLNRLNPISGLKKMMSMKALLQLLKSILMIIFISIAMFSDIKEFTKNVASFYSVPVPQTIFFIASSVFNIFIKICIAVIFIGILDYFIQWWQYEKDMKMSKHEIKEEMKQMEGDPYIRSEIKSRQRKMSSARMMQKVPHADVVIVNPEHFAVALKYDDKVNIAPVVIAKGRNNIALKIKQIAKDNYIKIEENPPLARALYKGAKLDKEIPPEFYQAVAEVLSYVYSAKGNR
ncbi:MAG: flhB2 [Oscillospiraceae bacterium]|nr:flhB2 [Oscillospiraceae bacterium]